MNSPTQGGNDRPRVALTDQPQGRDVNELPYGQMLRDHALWCETEGREGEPSTFDEADLRKLGSIKGYNLTALSAKRAVFYGLGSDTPSTDARAYWLIAGQSPGQRIERAEAQGIAPSASFALRLGGWILRKPLR